MSKMVVIADDLTGAADCAASCAAIGYRAAVLLHSPAYEQSEMRWPDADIISIDANSRCLPAEQAAELTMRLIPWCDSQNADCPGYILFKKIDSTLRGNVADELAALLNARRRSSSRREEKLSLLMAPALPPQGRTTVGGCLHVHGVPLEKTDIWKSETRPPESDIAKLLASAGLSCRIIDINAVRSDSARLRQSVSESAEQCDVVVCDAETDSDLRAIAKASLQLPQLTALVGSAGLASQIPQAIGITRHSDARIKDFAAGPTLFLIGTAASVSRQQAQALSAIPDITTFRTTPADLLNQPAIRSQIVQTLRPSRDTLLILDGSDQCSSEAFSQALSHLLADCAQILGGLVATGGETARAALDGLGIRQLRLIGEVEAGVPFSVADRWLRPLPIITKAGAFGSPHTLVRCHEFLRHIQDKPARLNTKHPLLQHES